MRVRKRADSSRYRNSISLVHRQPEKNLENTLDLIYCQTYTCLGLKFSENRKFQQNLLRHDSEIVSSAVFNGPTLAALWRTYLCRANRTDSN